MIVEEVRDGDPDMEYPAFVDGAGRCPPEDVGGPDGFMDFLEAVPDSAHEQHRDIVLYFASRFLDEFNDVQAVLVNCRFTGLSGRTITSVTPNRWTSSRPCHSEQIETSANVHSPAAPRKCGRDCTSDCSRRSTKHSISTRFPEPWWTKSLAA